MSIHEKFSDQEKKQLSYLGPRWLRQEPTREEAEFQEMVDAWLDAVTKGKGELPTRDEDAAG